MNASRTLLGVAVLLGACDERTAEEKGAAAAEERLGFAEGVAGVVDKRGKAIGEKAGRGVAELARGVASGVRDAVHPPVTVELSAAVTQAGITVPRASEGDYSDSGRTIEANVAFARPFDGRLALTAVDAEGSDLGVGNLEDMLHVASAAAEELRFTFTSSVRFSDAAKYRLDLVAAREVVVHESAAGLEASQLRESGQTVTTYVRFPAAFRGRLELRALDARGAELARSQPTAALRLRRDSAQFLDFPFDARASLRYVARYELRKVEAAR